MCRCRGHGGHGGGRGDGNLGRGPAFPVVGGVRRRRKMGAHQKERKRGEKERAGAVAGARHAKAKARESESKSTRRNHAPFFGRHFFAFFAFFLAPPIQIPSFPFREAGHSYLPSFLPQIAIATGIITMKSHLSLPPARHHRHPSPASKATQAPTPVLPSYLPPQIQSAVNLRQPTVLCVCTNKNAPPPALGQPRRRACARRSGGCARRPPAARRGSAPRSAAGPPRGGGGGRRARPCPGPAARAGRPW